jgi:hypothetical protein
VPHNLAKLCTYGSVRDPYAPGAGSRRSAVILFDIVVAAGFAILLTGGHVQAISNVGHSPPELSADSPSGQYVCDDPSYSCDSRRG